MRPRTASLMRSPSRARVDCQWNAKPNISTTKPVVADSVTDSAASDPHSDSIFSWITITWPGSALTSRSVASALPPLGRIISVTPPCWPGRVRNCAALMTSRIRSVSPSSPSRGTRATIRPSAPVTRTWRPAAMPHDGMKSGSNFCRRSTEAARSGRIVPMRSRRSASRSASADTSRFIEARFCRLWSITWTKAPMQMVIRKAMMRVGTARRSAGSAINAR